MFFVFVPLILRELLDCEVELTSSYLTSIVKSCVSKLKGHASILRLSLKDEGILQALTLKEVETTVLQSLVDSNQSILPITTLNALSRLTIPIDICYNNALL